MTFFHPDDRCNLDPTTNQRVGPSGLATFILVLCGIILLARSNYTIKDARERKKGVAYAVGCVLIECVFFGLYVLYYSKCRPWIGWLLFVFVSGMVVGLYSVLVPPPPTESSPPMFNFESLQDFMTSPGAPQAPAGV